MTPMTSSEGSLAGSGGSALVFLEFFLKGRVFFQREREEKRRRREKEKPLSLRISLSLNSHLEHEAVLPREHGPDEHRVEDLVVLLGLGGADVGELPLEVWSFFFCKYLFPRWKRRG